MSHEWLNKELKYEQDHLHPCERFSDDNQKPLSIKFEEWKEWKGNRNRLANLHLFSRVGKCQQKRFISCKICG